MDSVRPFCISLLLFIIHFSINEEACLFEGLQQDKLHEARSEVCFEVCKNLIDNKILS